MWLGNTVLADQVWVVSLPLGDQVTQIGSAIITAHVFLDALASLLAGLLTEAGDVLATEDGFDLIEEV
jgi:hypothetical protein